MKKKLISALLCAAMIATMVVGCGKSGSDSDSKDSGDKKESGDNLQIVFVPKVTGNSFFESANDGAQEFAKKVGGFEIKYDGSATA
ncbi:hypothetical protein RZ906_018635, partial [Clostridioides difficile]|nr:hypothetical protein [Clostridioides difficile]